ncbi:DnaA ATPase domain-containing protein, partial [Ralstonia solanacearum]
MALPQQLPLEFGATPAPTIDNFVATGNEEAVLRLSGLIAELAHGRAADRLVYLWGESGSGRSHLLHAVCAQAEAAGFQARYLEAKAPLEAFEYDPAITIWAIDDAERLDEWAQVAAFNLVN